jgi:hypothetical protein
MTGYSRLQGLATETLLQVTIFANSGQVAA